MWRCLLGIRGVGSLKAAGRDQIRLRQVRGRVECTKVPPANRLT